MGDDTSPDKLDRIAEDRRDTFFPVSVGDRHRRRVRDDHAPNAALYSAIKAAAEDDDRIASVNLMGSHAPGNHHKGEPTYHVVVRIENDGFGGASTDTTFLSRMLKSNDVTVTRATSESAFATNSDADAEDVIEGHTDRLELWLRPVETRVEPVEVPYSDVPTPEFLRHPTLRNNARMVLDEVMDYPDVTDSEAYEVARAFAVLLHITDPDVDDRSTDADHVTSVLKWLSSEVEAPWEFTEDAAGNEWVATDNREHVEMFCGCGDYSITTPAGSSPQAIDVVCPECGNHFGHGTPPSDPCPCRHGDCVHSDGDDRPPVEPIREWVDENRALFEKPGTITEEGTDIIAGLIADAIAEAGEE